MIRTQEDIFVQMQTRVMVFQQATALVQPILEENGGLKDVRGSSPVFYVGETTTAFEQQLHNTIILADWLLEEVS